MRPTTQTIGLICAAILTGLVIVCYTVLVALERDPSGMLELVKGLGLGTVIIGAAMITPGGRGSTQP